MKKLIRILDKSSFETYYKIKCQKIAIDWSGFKNAPDKDKLQIHYNNLIHNPNVYLYFLTNNQGIVYGYNQMTKIDDETVENNGHSVLDEYQGQGLGTLIIKLAIQEARKLGFKKYGGYISEKNLKSITNVEKNGWYKTDISEYRYIAALDRIDCFYFYQIEL